MIAMTDGAYALFEGSDTPHRISATKQEPSFFEVRGFLYDVDGSPVPSLLPAPKIIRIYSREDSILYGYDRPYNSNSGYQTR